MGLVVYPQPAGITAADVWGYSSRTLTQTKFPFWSAIITQTQGSISVASGGTWYVNIRPPTGETWLVVIASEIRALSSGSELTYNDYNGTTLRKHTGMYINNGTNFGSGLLIVNLERVLTNSLYGRISAYNGDSTSRTLYYGYSGFKLSQPQWAPQKQLNEISFKRVVTVPLAFPQLAHKAYLNPDNKIAYHLATEILAVDPDTGHAVETVEYHVLEEDLVNNLATFKADPKSTGWDKIFAKLKEEGITL